MPLITDWLMFGITFAYSIITAFILLSNRKSTKVMERQLKESKREFSETQRLSVLPYLSASVDKPIYIGEQRPLSDMFISIAKTIDNDRDAWITAGVAIKNIGSGLACNIHCRCDADIVKKSPVAITNFLCKDVEESFNITISGEYKERETNQTIELVFCFLDILGNQYEQSLEIHLLIPSNQHMIVTTQKMKEIRQIKHKSED